MKSELIEKLEGLLAEANISAVAPRIKNIQREYEQLFQKGLDKARQDFVDEGGKAREFVFTKSEEDEKIVALLEKFRKLKKEADARIADDERKNLSIKKEIIREINDLIQLSTNVGSALKKLNELQGKWRETGAVSPHEYKELQAEYSKTVENFNYNLSIYRELQEHDLKKNHELKTEILEKIKRLADNNSIKDVERLVKLFRNEWEEVGPVENARWDELKTLYRAELESIYARIKAHYKLREAESDKNLEQKKEISAKAAEISAAEPQSEEEWQKKTEEVIALQAQWKSIGKSEQKKADALWAEFRTHCDNFFAKKKVHYEAQKVKHVEFRKQKQALIEEAEKLSASVNWKEDSEKLIQLQNRWKKITPLSQTEEHRLFTKFRKACNVFFEAKRAHYDAVDEQYVGNLKVKEALIEKLNAFVLSGDVAADRSALKAFGEEWNAAGLVPFKEKKRVNDAFFQKMDELFEKLNISGEEKALVRFTNKIERMSGGESGTQTLEREIEHFKKQADEITKTLTTYENNMGFFKYAKKKNQMMLDLEAKIEEEKAKLAEVKKKIKMVNEAMRKLRESNAPAAEKNETTA